MNKFILSLLLISSMPLIAQENLATVFGFVEGDDTNAELSGVTVTVIGESEDDLISGGLSDQGGYFEIEGLAPGNYNIRLSRAGYRAETVPVLVFAGNQNYNLGNVTLTSNGQAIEEITVLGQQGNFGPSLESRVYSLENNIAQSVGSLADVMRTLPGVTIEQDGRIQLRGSDRVVILIDGKQSSLTGFGNQAGLDTIPASGIASIEIINNPSSRFDSTGMAGVINIKYNEDDTYGLSGDIGMTTSVGQLSTRKADLPTELGSFSSNPKIIPSANLTYNTDTRRYFVNAQVFLQEDLPNNEFTSRFYDDGRITFSQVPENREQIQTIINGGMDWNINDSNQITLSAIIDYESHEDNAEVPFIDARTNERYRFWFWREEEVTGFFNLNTAWEHRFREPGHTLTTSLQYTRGWEDEDYFLNDVSAIRTATDATFLRAKENTLPIQIDYVRPLKSGRVEVGAKYQKRWIPITYDVDRGANSIIYEGLGDWSEWGEDVASVYGNLVYQSERIGVEGGVRIEQTDVYYDLPPENIYYDQSDDYGYFKIYPNFRVSYTIDDSNSLAFYYSSRVDRPGEAELRIFPKYDDPELLKVGNPYLRPQFTDSVELAYERLWDTGSFIASIYHRDIEDPFLRVFDIDDSDSLYNIVNRIYQNVGSSSNEGFELILSQDVGDFWKFSGSFNWFENTVDSYQTEILFPTVRPFLVERTSDDTWNLNINNQFTLPYDTRMQLSYTYYAARNFVQGNESARSSLDIGINKSVLANRGELVFSVTDLLNKFGIQQQIRGNGFDAVYENFFETQVVSLGFRYFLQ